MIIHFIEKIIADLYSGITFFSRLPFYRLYQKELPFSFARAIWAWPFIAIFLGGIEGSFLNLLCWTHLDPWIIAFTTLGFHLLLTGGLHEDGLADCADGFGGGHIPSQKLSIMKDSRLGSYGTLSLFIILGIQISAIACLIKNQQSFLIIFIITAVLSRSAMLCPLFILKPARSNGIASTLDHIPLSAYYTHITITLLICFLLLPWQIACYYLIVTLIISSCMSFIIYQQIKGYNGDSLGAVQVLTATGILGISTLFH